jgi:hypothetical protein
VEGAIDEINRSRDAMNARQLDYEAARVRLASAEAKREAELERLRKSSFGNALARLNEYETVKARTAARREALVKMVGKQGAVRPMTPRTGLVAAGAAAAVAGAAAAGRTTEGHVAPLLSVADSEAERADQPAPADTISAATNSAATNSAAENSPVANSPAENSPTLNSPDLRSPDLRSPGGASARSPRFPSARSPRFPSELDSPSLPLRPSEMEALEAKTRAVQDLESECLRLACALGPVFESLVPYFTIVAVLDANVVELRAGVERAQAEVKMSRRAYHAAMDHLEHISLEIQTAQAASRCEAKHQEAPTVLYL